MRLLMCIPAIILVFSACQKNDLPSPSSQDNQKLPKKMVVFENFSTQEVVVEIISTSDFKKVAELKLDPVICKSKTELNKTSRKDRKRYSNSVPCSKFVFTLPNGFNRSQLSYRFLYHSTLDNKTKFTELIPLKKTNEINPY